MRHIAVVCVSLALLIAPVAAKGPTTRIVIKDLERGSVVEITDRSVLDQFHVWSGQGTYSGPPGQGTEGTQGFIIDWQAGIVDQRPPSLRRYEISFYVTKSRSGSVPLTNAPGEELAYVVLYENDPSTRQGYVYLPGKSDEHFALNVRSIHRRLEGNWLRANHKWQTAMANLPAAR
jgi:hypothetical protein